LFWFALDIRTGKHAPSSQGKKGSSTSNPSKPKGAVAHNLLDMLAGAVSGSSSSSKGKKKSGVPTTAVATPSGPKKKQFVRRGDGSAEDEMSAELLFHSSDSEERSENEWLEEPSVSAISMADSSNKPKKKKKKNNVEEEELSLSEEERRQTALRREQKRINIANAMAGIESVESKQQEEEDVHCCLCHSADSDEFNPIVMCDGPCG
jgi:hypothetical protein